MDSKRATPSAVLCWESLLVGALAFLFYALTCARDLQWGDPAKLTLYVHDRLISFSQEGHVGLVLWSWLFSLLPIEPYALRLHLSSALTMGAALGVAHSTLLALSVSRVVVRLAIAAVAIAHTVWFTATMFESYPLVLLVLAVSLWLLVVRRNNVLAGAVLGLGISVHPLTFFGMFGILWGVWKSKPGFQGVFRFMMGLAVGIALSVTGLLMMSRGQTGLHGINWGTATAFYAGLIYPLKNIPLLTGYALYNFASLALVFLVLGLKRLSTNERIALLLFALPHYLVAAFWLPQRAYLIPVPVYFVLAYPIALGAGRLLALRRLSSAAAALAVIVPPILAYIAAPPVFARTPLSATIRDAPYRAEATYFLRPWKFSERSARVYLADLARTLPEGSALLGDWVMHTTVMADRRIENWRPDVVLIYADAAQCHIMAAHLASGKRAFVMDNEPGYIPDCFLRQGRLVPVPEIESLFEIVGAATG